MKLSLMVTQGKSAGQLLPINLPQFVIGRDPQCQLRPASPVISKRHCALLNRGGKAFVRDLKSTNGTLVNDQPITEEVEVHHGDKLTIGPLVFTIQVEAGPPVNKPTPPPQKGADEPVDYESVAAMLLATDEDDTGGEQPAVDQEEVMGDSTVVIAPPEPKASEPADKKKPSPAADKANTSSAAAALLAKYSKRPRG